MTKKLLVLLTILITIVTFRPPIVEAQTSEDDWLRIINIFRSQSNLSPVVENPAWNQGTYNHSCWMLLNTIAHDETPGTPGYSISGDEAGNNGNVAVSSSALTNAESFINLWMTGPFHAIGILRSGLRESSYGSCTSPPSPTNSSYKAAATLDVYRGLTPVKPLTPTVFPGPEATVNLSRFISESPDPRGQCGWQGRSVGLPLIALMPSQVTDASATLFGPNGAIQTCILHPGNTTSEISSMLKGDNAIIVIPADPLVNGRYEASISSNGGSQDWGFTINTSAMLSDLDGINSTPLPRIGNFQPITPFRYADSRSSYNLVKLKGGTWTRLPITGIPSDSIAISANFTVVDPRDNGFLTVNDCNDTVPNVSTLNYLRGEAISNQSMVPLNGDSICIYSIQDTELVIDINGYVSASATEKLTPIEPFRLIDTRLETKLSAGVIREIQVVDGSRIPVGAGGVSINIVALNSGENGWMRVVPCGAGDSVSNINFQANKARSNSAMVKLSPQGTLCIFSSTEADLIIDVNGWFGSSGQLQFKTAKQQRVLDTRNIGSKIPANLSTPIYLNADTSAGIMSLNVVSAEATDDGWLNIGSCHSAPNTSVLNYPGVFAAANGLNLKSASSTICAYSQRETHMIIDINGYWI